jgi:hypothetical protein
MLNERIKFPNPLSWDHDFRTTIPFSIPNGGDSDLPDGKYFYQIEAPKGNIIVNKSMLIVK